MYNGKLQHTPNSTLMVFLTSKRKQSDAKGLIPTQNKNENWLGVQRYESPSGHHTKTILRDQNKKFQACGSHTLSRVQRKFPNPLAACKHYRSITYVSTLVYAVLRFEVVGAFSKSWTAGCPILPHTMIEEHPRLLLKVELFLKSLSPAGEPIKKSTPYRSIGYLFTFPKIASVFRLSKDTVLYTLSMYCIY